MAPNRRRRNTPQRATILAKLEEMHTHPTATELYAEVKERLPRISLGTVYRNLEVLREDGLIHKMEFGLADARFDACLEPHDHIRCTGCGAVSDIPATDRPFTPALPTAAGFEVMGYRLEYYGLCPVCNREVARKTG
ncbi:MAG: transcriptional repressor [bacterium]|nr:transcriptional repressor [bacterium]